MSAVHRDGFMGARKVGLSLPRRKTPRERARFPIDTASAGARASPALGGRSSLWSAAASRPTVCSGVRPHALERSGLPHRPTDRGTLPRRSTHRGGRHGRGVRGGARAGRQARGPQVPVSLAHEQRRAGRALRPRGQGCERRRQPPRGGDARRGDDRGRRHAVLGDGAPRRRASVPRHRGGPAVHRARAPHRQRDRRGARRSAPGGGHSPGSQARQRLLGEGRAGARDREDPRLRDLQGVRQRHQPGAHPHGLGPRDAHPHGARADRGHAGDRCTRRSLGAGRLALSDAHRTAALRRRELRPSLGADHGGAARLARRGAPRCAGGARSHRAALPREVA